MNARTVLFGALASAVAACGSSSSSSAAPAPTPSTGFFITISNMAWSPSDLRVPPGATVTVINRDSTTHSVTSEASDNSFTPAAVSSIAFDTGAFTGTKTFSIPSTATANTRVPFYCTVHTSTMNPQNGSITIDPSAVPTTAPGGGSGGGGGGGY